MEKCGFERQLDEQFNGDEIESLWNDAYKFPHDLKPGLALKLSKQIGNDPSELGSYKCMPKKFLREQCEFTESVRVFLNRYARRFVPQSNPDGSTTFFVPIYGISNRSLPQSDDFSPKYFKAQMAVKVPAAAVNIDQCTISRGPRTQISEEQYKRSISEELTGSFDLRPQTGPLSFFTHGAFTAAGETDDDTLRIAMESGVPTVNVDWRSTPGKLLSKIVRYGIDFKGALEQEKLFEPELDKTVQYLDPKRCTFLAFSRGSAFNAAYLNHRYDEKSFAARIKGVVFSHADLETEKFRERDSSGNNPITAATENTIVLGNSRDKALGFAKRWLRGDRVGDASADDIAAVRSAGGEYVIDEAPRKGGNFNHYINYRSIGRMVRSLIQLDQIRSLRQESEKLLQRKN